MNRKEHIVFRREHEWLAECIDKIVQAKTDVGIKTSFSWELIRLARCGMVQNMEGDGAAFDRAILKDKHA